MRTIKRTLLLMFLCFSVARICASQEVRSATLASPLPKSIAKSTQDDDLKTQQQLVAELKKLRLENAGLKEEVAAKNGTIAVQEKIIKIVEERGDFFKEAAAKGIKAGDNCGLIQERYDRMVAQYEAEEQRLRHENDKLRSSRNTRAIFTGLGGVAVGWAVCNRGQ